MSPSLLESLESRRHLAATPTVALTTPDGVAQEGADTATIRLTRTGDLAKALTVTLTWSGSAKGRDLLETRTSVKFAAGRNKATITLTAKDDGVPEATETARIALAASKAYKIASGKSVASIRISDAPAAQGDLKWQAGPNAPIGRVEPESVVVGNKLYVFSGYTDDGWQPIRRVDRFDPKTNKWKRLGDMPIGITHAAVAVVGDKVWFAGGYAERVGVPGQQDIAIQTVKVYDTATDKWSDGPSLPAQRGSGGLGLVDNKLYFIAGERRDRANMKETWVLDLAKTKAGWQPRAPIPEGRTHFGTVVIDDQIYVMGGQWDIDENATFLKTAFRYDPKADKWTRLADLPIAMSHYSPCTVVYRDRIYMFGGESAFNVESTQSLEYDPKTDTYRQLAPVPVARAAAVTGVIGDRFIFTSGKNHGWKNETFIATWA